MFVLFYLFLLGGGGHTRSLISASKKLAQRVVIHFHYTSSWMNTVLQAFMTVCEFKVMCMTYFSEIQCIYLDIYGVSLVFLFSDERY